KLFAIVLAVVMVLGVASSALAFTWNASAGTTADNFANRYKIEVIKLANETGIIGTNKLIEAPGATAVNNAPVYFYIRLTVAGAEATPADRDAVQTNAVANVSFTALADAAGVALAAPAADVSLAALTNGVYYYDLGTQTFVLITDGGLANTLYSKAAIEARCQDTATAKAYAMVKSERPLNATPFQSNGYWVSTGTGTVIFQDTEAAPKTIVTFSRNGDGKITAVAVTGTAPDANWIDDLYTFLGFTAADVAAGKIFMTNGNLRAALGFSYKGESSITWAANSTPIILDPAIGIGIPKTGDNASVIGFAMIMVAVVAAAVAVKKVNA
ncbi:MAG: hypothetical protein VB049_00735, partial [Candidatus Pelethousia sp.]|nr:hypothetical protein [Candidatus Pelethousia sp.]